MLKRLLLSVTLGLIPLSAYDVIPAPLHVKKEATFTKELAPTEYVRTTLDHDEEYKLVIAQDGVTFYYGHDAGLARAMATLAQLQDQLKRNPAGIPTGEIHDKPVFAWRGMMLDVSRQFYTLEQLKSFTLMLALYKFNKFHIHLTDDQGWRLEVPGYPRLREIGSKRAESMGDGVPCEGMYTRAELKELVIHCQQLGIEIIPELDVPGHNQALAASYPEFFCDAKGIEVRTGEAGPDGNRSFLVCPCKEDMWKFYDAAIKELTEIFPSSYIHLGGDEAPTKDWDKCPECLAARKEQGLNNGQDQMRAFLARMGEVVRKHGKQPQFWYENDGHNLYREGEVVYCWRLNSMKKVADTCRDNKLNLIMAPGEHCYLDYPQIAGQRTYNWMPTLPLERVYNFSIADYNYAPLMGIHCTMWTEHLPTMEHLLYRTFPRAMAVAEVGWSTPENRSWEDFQRRLKLITPSYEERTGYTLERTKDNEPALNHKW